MHPKIRFILVGSGLILSLLIHTGIMFDRIPLDQKHILYINLLMILGLLSGKAFKTDSRLDALNPLKAAMKVLPLWLTVGLGAILIYSAAVFVNYTYLDSPLKDRPDIIMVLTKMNKGASAATLFFYAAAFGLLNLQWKLKETAELSDTPDEPDKAGEDC